MAEDSPDDALLIQLELKRGGYQVIAKRVETEADMRRALTEQSWDLVVSDFSMPGFDAFGALRTLRETGQDLPFLVVSGTIGEETAVGVLKAGAHDFVLKGKLARFLPAVERELREASVRRERRAAATALRESEQKHRQIVETAQEGIWQLDLAGRTTFANQRLAQMLGATPEQLIGRAVHDFVSSTFPSPPVSAAELELRRVDGTSFWASVSVSSVVEEGVATGSLAMVTDVTERRQIQSQLLISDRLASIGMLAAGVAHEINNPLSAVVGNLELAAESSHGDLHMGELLSDALEAAQRVRQIARDLKLLSRAEEEERLPIDVHEAIESSLRLARPEVRHRAQIVCDLRPVPRVLANESRLGQVLLNLIVNAAQAMPTDGEREHTISISTREHPSGDVLIEVADTGMGMTPDVLANLFTPFFTTKPRGVGTGLGLSICQRIVASMGGKITASSTPGQGSTFQVLLPATALMPRTTPPALPRPRSHRRARLLVVDDEPLIGVLLERILQEHEVVVTRRTTDAFTRLASESFDLVLCDMVMPDGTGMELYERVAASAPQQAKRFVFVTGGALTSQERAFLERIDIPCVHKPFDAGEIRAIVENLRPL